ncbi:MAG: RNA pyrophosphohydrolase [Gammaproteobacteria bacterium]|nr:RNA pyrophosphohydrolase [Gammaproteobacteria bacterium]
MSNDWIDDEGFRANVGIILSNTDGRLLLGGRVGAKGWQFPQGGMLRGEDPQAAMYRELEEEVGLESQHVEILGVTRDWLRYRLPDKFVRRHSKPLCIGQKQRWFMLKLISSADKVRFDRCDQPEFDRVRWVDFWRPVNEVIYFKRRVYASALHELGSTVFPEGLPPRPRWWPRRWRAVFDKDIEKTIRARDEMP